MMDESTIKLLQLIKKTFELNKIDISILKINHSSFCDDVSIKINDIKNISKINSIVKTITTLLNTKIDQIFDFDILTLKIYKGNDKIYQFKKYMTPCKHNQGFIFFGVDSNESPIYEKIDDIKSLLICGSSGSGKSNLLHQLILSYLILNDSSYLMLIDPKYSELSFYKKSELGNRLINEVASTFEEAKKSLMIFSNLLDSRYKKMMKRGERFSSESPILLVIDEYASLFTNSKEKKIINNLISRIASLGRAARCYLIIATQHPTNANLTNSIRVNLQSKLALHCESSNQSFNVINSREATKLKAKGEYLLKVDGKEMKFGKTSLITNELINNYLKG